jgi:hypothetical protein
VLLLIVDPSFGDVISRYFQKTTDPEFDTPVFDRTILSSALSVAPEELFDRRAIA